MPITGQGAVSVQVLWNNDKLSRNFGEGCIAILSPLPVANGFVRRPRPRLFENFLTPIYRKKCSVYYLQYVYTWIEKCTWLVMSAVFLKMQYFTRIQAVVYTVGLNVVVSEKQCQIESFLIRTINRKWYMAYRIAAIPMTLNDHRYSHTASLFKCEFSYSSSVQQLTKFQLTYSASHSHSEMSELLVYLELHNCCRTAR